MTSAYNYHTSLDLLIENNPDKMFISDWNCFHPFMNIMNNNTLNKDYKNMYCYISEDIDTTDRIKRFHLSVDKANYDEQQLLISEGATSIIYLFCLWLKNNNIKQVYYIPPMYFLFHKHFDFFSIDIIKVSEKQVYEEEYDFTLPNKKTILIFSDPLWYAGVKYKKKKIYR